MVGANRSSNFGTAIGLLYSPSVIISFAVVEWTQNKFEDVMKTDEDQASKNIDCVYLDSRYLTGVIHPTNNLDIIGQYTAEPQYLNLQSLPGNAPYINTQPSFDLSQNTINLPPSSEAPFCHPKVNTVPASMSAYYLTYLFKHTNHQTISDR
jgi:hypothetical protein